MIDNSRKKRFLLKGINIDSRTKSYIEKRIEKTEKLLKKIKECQYEIEISLDKKGKFRVEMMVKTPFKLYRAEEISQSIEGSADLVMNELYHQISRDKDKMKDLKIRGARSIKKKTVLDKDSRF
jgi:ribosomal subunit interface protein